MSISILLKSPSRALLKALCLRDLSHQTLRIFFNTRKSLLFLDSFRGKNSENNFSEFLEVLGLHIAELHARRSRQRQILYGVMYTSPTYGKVINAYMEGKSDIKTHFAVDRDSSCDQDHWIHGLNDSSPTFLNAKVSCDISDEILGELSLLQYLQCQESVWEFQLENSIDQENSFCGNEDPYLPYGDSYKCSSILHKILEEIQNCKKNLFLIQEKNPEVFELVQEYFQDIVKIINYENSISHDLEDHEIYDDDVSN